MINMRALENVLTSALERKPKRLSFNTTYSHKNTKDWLQSILPEWNIIIPDDAKQTSSPLTESNTMVLQIAPVSEGLCALSEWPASGDCRDGVRQWLEDQHLEDPDDLIDGACEPLAFYLSHYFIKAFVKGVFQGGNRLLDINYLHNIYREAKRNLEDLSPKLAACEIFGEYIKQKEPSPSFWPNVNKEDACFKEFLFGHDLAKQQLIKASQSKKCDQICIPLYILCYLFDADELTNAELNTIKEETAQYSLHAIGLYMHTTLKTIIVADPNGALREGFNMEFLSMPLTRLKRKPTTSVSRYDRDKYNQTFSKRTKIDED
jgi:hypothetical protein